MNIFINLFLVIIILLTKLTCFRKFFILYISRSSAFSCCNLNTYIVFQSFRAILLLKASEISFFTQGLCIFPILSIIALNFPKSNVQRNLFQNIFKKIGNVLRILTYFNGDCCNDFSTSFCSFYSAVVKYVYKTFLYYRNIHIFSIIICIFLRIIFRIFHYFIFACCCFFFLSLHCSCVFALTFYMFFICLLILRTIIHQQVLLFSYSCQ